MPNIVSKNRISFVTNPVLERFNMGIAFNVRQFLHTIKTEIQNRELDQKSQKFLMGELIQDAIIVYAQHDITKKYSETRMLNGNAFGIAMDEDIPLGLLVKIKQESKNLYLNMMTGTTEIRDLGFDDDLKYYQEFQDAMNAELQQFLSILFESVNYDIEVFKERLSDSTVLNEILADALDTNFGYFPDLSKIVYEERPIHSGYGKINLTPQSSYLTCKTALRSFIYSLFLGSLTLENLRNDAKLCDFFADLIGTDELTNIFYKFDTFEEKTSDEESNHKLAWEIAEIIANQDDSTQVKKIFIMNRLPNRQQISFDLNDNLADHNIHVSLTAKDAFENLETTTFFVKVNWNELSKIQDHISMKLLPNPSVELTVDSSKEPGKQMVSEIISPDSDQVRVMPGPEFIITPYLIKHLFPQSAIKYIDKADMLNEEKKDSEPELRSLGFFGNTGSAAAPPCGAAPEPTVKTGSEGPNTQL